jgi:hypothetical protein
VSPAGIYPFAILSGNELFKMMAGVDMVQHVAALHHLFLPGSPDWVNYRRQMMSAATAAFSDSRHECPRRLRQPRAASRASCLAAMSFASAPTGSAGALSRVMRWSWQSTAWQ